MLILRNFCLLFIALTTQKLFADESPAEGTEHDSREAVFLGVFDVKDIVDALKKIKPNAVSAGENYSSGAGSSNYTSEVVLTRDKFELQPWGKKKTLFFPYRLGLDVEHGRGHHTPSLDLEIGVVSYPWKDAEGGTTNFLKFEISNENAVSGVDNDFLVRVLEVVFRSETSLRYGDRGGDLFRVLIRTHGSVGIGATSLGGSPEVIQKIAEDLERKIGDLEKSRTSLDLEGGIQLGLILEKNQFSLVALWEVQGEFNFAGADSPDNEGLEQGSSSLTATGVAYGPTLRANIGPVIIQIDGRKSNDFFRTQNHFYPNRAGADGYSDNTSQVRHYEVGGSLTVTW